jgi:RNA recognition motif-containing protein
VQRREKADSPIVGCDEPGYYRPDEQEDPTIPRKIFVGNLSFQTTSDQLSAAFAPAGQVVGVHIGTDRETGRSRGFAFVEFATDAEAEKAIESFNNFELDGRRLRVNAAEDRPPRRGPRPGGGGGFAPPGPRSFAAEAPPEGGDGGGFGRPFRKGKGSRRGLRGKKRSLR